MPSALKDTNVILNHLDKVIKQPTSKRECSLQCSSHTLRVACELKYFPEAVNKTVVLLDANCISRSNGTHLIIHTGLDDCGTTAEAYFYLMIRFLEYMRLF